MLEIQHSPGPPNPVETADTDCVTLDANHFNFIHIEENIFNRFTKLENLNLSECSIYHLPQSIFAIKTLKTLDISKNKISEVPLEIGFLQNLKEVNLEDNPFCTLLVDSGVKLDSSNIIKTFRKICTKYPKPRQRLFLPNTNSSQRSFLILSYNILAPYTVRPERFPLSLEKNLSIEHRLPLIKEQLAEFPASIVCLQEVEGRLLKEIEQFMKDRGFSCSYCPKGRYEKLTGDQKECVHGEATFVRTTHFNILDTQLIQYRNLPKAHQFPIYSELLKHDETAVITILQSKRIAQNFVLAVVNVHLFWEQGPLQEEVRVAQLCLALDAAKQLASKSSSLYDIIIAGDFNSSPHTKPLEILKREMIDVYDYFNMNQPFTIYAPNFRERIDYILATQNYMKPLSVLEQTDVNDIIDRYIGFPADHYPSDHLPIAANFLIPKKQTNKNSSKSSKIQIDKPEKTPCKIAVSTPSQSTSSSSSPPSLSMSSHHHVISARGSSPGKITICVAKK